MKINICLIFCLLINVSIGYISEKQVSMEAATQLLSQRFAEIQDTVSTNALFGSKPYKYKVAINFIKETDKSDEKPKEIQGTLSFEKEKIILGQGHNLKDYFYTEYLFFNF